MLESKGTPPGTLHFTVSLKMALVLIRILRFNHFNKGGKNGGEK